MKVAYDTLQKYFAESLPDTEELAELLTMYAFEVESIEDGNIFHIDVLHNRDEDAKEAEGLAREISVITGKKLKEDIVAEKGSRSIVVRTIDINKVLGTDMDDSEIEDVLVRYGFYFERKDNDFVVYPPENRPDLTIKEDIIEEIGRMYGYGNIKARMPEASDSYEVNKDLYYLMKIRNFFISKGYSEVQTYTFVEKGEVELENPLASDKKYLRKNLSGGLLNAFAFNSSQTDRLEVEFSDLKIFEIGTVFTKKGEHLSLAIASDGAREAEKDLQILFDDLGANIDYELSDDIVLEINISNLVEKTTDPISYKDLNIKLSEKDVTYKPISKYPFIKRDIAVWVPESVSKDKLVNILKENGGELMVTEPRLVDEFTPPKGLEHAKEGKTSYAYRLVFQSIDRTLEDKEVNNIMDNIYKEIKKQENWEIR